MQLYESLLLNSERIVEPDRVWIKLYSMNKSGQLENASWNRPGILNCSFTMFLFGCRKNTGAMHPFKKSEIMEKPLKLQIYGIIVKQI